MPSDYGHKVADKAIAATEKKIRSVYKQAGAELQKKMEQFMSQHRAKGTEMLEKLKNGEITQAAYHSWMRGQVFIGKQWERKIDQAARIMNDANNQAAGVVRDGKINVFAENYNYESYQLEKRSKGAVSFDLYDERTAARLIKDKPKMLPEWKIDEPKDYRWNRQKVENAITQGIIQGESIDQITDRLVSSLCTQNENKMRTFSRTAITGAQNAGRQANMEDAEDMGIKVKKRWLATLDSRTRDTHQELDGQEVPVDEPFEVDGMEIMYPGDPNAEPELVYNCRCTMIEVYEGIDRKTVRRAYDDDENGERDTKNSYTVEDMTYKEWKEWKENGKQPVEREPEQEKPAEINHLDRARQIISEHQGDWSTDDLQALGTEVTSEIDKRIEADPPPVEYFKEIDKIDSEMQTLYDQYETKQKEYKRTYSSSDRETLNKLAQDYNEKFQQRAKLVQDSSEYYSNIVGKTIADVRDVGGVTRENRALYMTVKAGKAADTLQKALNYYPSAWLDHTASHTVGLTPKWTTGRAHYSPGLGHILVDGKLGTSIHELAHRFERCVPGLLKSEKEFYEKRTAGEALKWLGKGYRTSEKTRVDHFIHKYMGKDYGGTAYELASMGIEYAFTQYDKLSQDKEMLKWVLGMLTGL